MQVAVETDTRKVRQHGSGLGDLAGCQIVDLTDAQAAQFAALLAQVEGDGYVRHDEDGAFERIAASQAHLDTQSARQQEDDALRTAVREHPDPVVRELSRRLGMA